MKSMTGFGKSEIVNDGRKISLELKSVNNRYLEINTRLPRGMAEYDDIIRKSIQSNFSRGTIEVYFNYENSSANSKTVSIDLNLAHEYMQVAKKLRAEFMLNEDFQVTALMRTPDIVKVEAEKENSELLVKMIKECVEASCKELEKMRTVEGEGIKSDLTKLTAAIISLLEKAVGRAPKIVEDFKTKLSLRINDILNGVAVDENKLLNEVAFFADKADINEEISRLTSHINQFLKLLEDKEPVGRKLDFLSQEMNREINTMGSKSNDVELTQYVVAMKNELEKIKEQIRNVE